jgi:hypothetical protein
MKILIDNKEFSVDFNKVESFSLIMDKVNEALYKEGRLIFSMFINGRVLNLNDNIEVNDISLVEVFTKSPRAIILEALSQFDEYLDKLAENSEVSMTYFQEGENIFGDFYFVDVMQSLEWFSNILFSVKENTAVDLGNQEFEILFNEYSDCFKRAGEAYENKDKIMFFEIVDFEIIPVLEDFTHIIEGLYGQIIEEEIHDRFYA